MRSKNPEIQEKTLEGLRKLEDFTRRLHAVSDHTKGKSSFNPVAEDNFEALQGKYLQQLREEAKIRRVPEFAGVQQYEQEEEKRMQVEAVQNALNEMRDTYWRKQTGTVSRDYSQRLEREEIAHRGDVRVAGQRIVRHMPPQSQQSA